MKINGLKYLLIALSITVLTDSALAQGKKKGGAKKPAASTSSGYGAPSTPATNSSTSGYGAPSTPATNSGAASGYGQPPANSAAASSGYGTQPPASGGVKPKAAAYDPKIPFVFKKGASGSLGDSVKSSKRNDNAIEKQLEKARVPLAWDYTREDDAVYRQKLTIEIDIREKINQPFGYAADENNGNQRFVSIVLDAVKKDTNVIAFNADDDRFTTPMTVAEVMKNVFGGNDTTAVSDLDNPDKIAYYSVSPKNVQPDSIYKFRIKEEVIFDKEASRLYRRILGICPIMPYYNSAGVNLGDVPMFWIYYPDIRQHLAKYEVYNPKNLGARQTWEDYLENHMFSYYILKSSLDNVKNQELKNYVKDPLFRLLEGEKVKSAIFNYEQGLWAY